MDSKSSSHAVTLKATLQVGRKELILARNQVASSSARFSSDAALHRAARRWRASTIVGGVGRAAAPRWHGASVAATRLCLIPFLLVHL